jgi:hypothetical protein
LAVVLLGALLASPAAVAAEDVRVTQSAAGYVAGAKVVVTCQIDFPPGRQIQSLLWTPSLPAGWSLDPLEGSVTGHGSPTVDPDGYSVIFNAQDLSAHNPLVFQYSVNVPSGVVGEWPLNGLLEYQLDGMPNPGEVAPPSALLLKDADASHAALGYLAGTLMTVTCTFSHPEGVALQSLLWRPVLPSAEWKLVSAAEGSTGVAPEVDADGAAILLTGSLNENPLNFTYTVLVPPSVTGVQELRGEVEYQLVGMPNPAITWAETDPLILRPLHTLQIVSPYGIPEPEVGVYTNFYGTVLTNEISASVTIGNLGWACAGWLLSSHAPANGTGTNCVLTLTNNTVLSWIWVAPQVGDRTVTELETLAFQARVVYTNGGFEPLDLLYSLDAASVTAGMAISPTGAFIWTPSEQQGNEQYTVTVTVTDNGPEPHWLTAAETFTITVVETNRPPVLDFISNHVADEQSTLTFTATASDPDHPAQNLAFSLDAASVTAGMTIDSNTGLFSWSPTAGQAAAGPYTVTVTVTDDGANPSALRDSQSFSIGVVDSRATHASEGYLAGRTAEIHCTFEHPDDKPLLSLLWHPLLPAGWSLVSTKGQGAPEIDLSDGTIIFTSNAELNSPNPLTFSYVVSVPDGLTGPLEFRAEADYLVGGMANPLTIPVNPDPLILREMHTYRIVSSEGECEPPVGIYTNWYGTNLSASVRTPLTVGTRTFACTGWSLVETNQAPVVGATENVSWVLTNDVVLTWLWVAPLIAPTNAFFVAMDEDGDWQAPVISASEPYRPELESGLLWSLLIAPTGGIATVNGVGAKPSIDYAPTSNWYGTDTFVVQVADGLGGYDRATITVTVNPVNDSPVLAPIGPKQTDEFTPMTFTVSATDVDRPVQDLTFSISGAPPNSAFDPQTGVFSWVPVAGQAGTEGTVYTVTVTVTDNGIAPDHQSDSETFTVTLLPVRATHATTGYIPGKLLAIDCQFDYPTARNLQSFLWRPELPAGWTLASAEAVSGGAFAEVDPDDEGIVLQGDLAANPLTFRYFVQVPETGSGTNAIGGLIEYQLSGMPNPGTVRAQPDPLIIPMLLTLQQLSVSDKVYDGLTNATVVTYGDLSGLMDGHVVSLVTIGAVAWFESPQVGSNKVVTVSGLTLTGPNADWYAIGAQVATAAVTQATLTVTADPQSKTYGEVNPPLTFQYTGFVNNEDAAVLDTLPTAATTVAQFTGAGTHVGAITVSGGIDNNYAFTYIPADFTIDPKDATVVADAKTKIYTEENPELTAVVSGTVNGDTIDYSLATTALKLSDVGDYPITVTLGANLNYNVSITNALLTITKADAVIVVSGATVEYDGDAHGATGTATSANGGDLSGLLNLGPTFTNVPGGIVNWSFAGDLNHSPTNGTVLIAITKKPASVTPAANSKVYGADDPMLSGELTGFLAADAVTAAYSRTAGETVAGSPYTISAVLSPAGVLGNYDITYNTAAFTITKAASVTVVTINGGPFTYSGAAVTPATVSVTGAGGLNLTPAPTYASNINAGTATASYSYAGDANHEPSADSKDFNIGKASATILVSGATVVYDGAAHGATGTATGADGADLTALLNLGASFTDVPGGTAEWTFAGDDNHIAASGSVEIAIGKAASVTVVTINGGPFTYSGAAVTPATVSVTGAGGLNLTPAPTYASNINAGTATASYSYAGDANHEASADTKDFNIGKASATILVSGATVVYDGAAHGATGTATGADGANLNALLDLGGSFTDVPGGTANWTFAGDDNHIAASGSVEIAITKAASVTVVTINGGPFTYTGDALTPATVSVTGAGGLNLTPAPAYANNLNAGTATASYSYAGDDNHEGSADTKDFTITKAAAVIVVTPYSVTYDGLPHTASGTATGVKGEALAGLDLSGTTHMAAGTYNGDAWTFTDVTGNYSNANGTVADVIGKKAASVTPAANTKVYGVDDPILSGELDGFLPADAVTAAYSRAAGETVAGGPYTISAVLSPAGVLGNYDITYNTADFAITAMAVTVTADAQTKVSGAADPALSYTFAPALIGGDAFSGALTRDPGESAASYAIRQGTLALNANYALEYIGADLEIIPLVICGTVFNDLDRLMDLTVDGVATNAGGLFANLVDAATHLILASVAVNMDGTYAFSDGVAINNSYEIILTETGQTVGDPLAAATLPSSWMSTGEHVGAGLGDDGTANSRLLVSPTTDGLRDVNFGIVYVPFVLYLEMIEPLGIRLQWQSIPGRSYQIYTTKSLTETWTYMDTVLADKESSWLDLKRDPQDRQRFFKIVMVHD